MKRPFVRYSSFFALLALIVAFGGWFVAHADSEAQPGDTAPGVIPQNQKLAPIGKQHIFSSWVHGIAFCGDLYVLANGVRGKQNGSILERIDWRHNLIVKRMLVPIYPGMDSITCAGQNRVLIDGSPLPADKGATAALIVDSFGVHPVENSAGSSANDFGLMGGASAGGRTATIPMTLADQVAVVDLSRNMMTNRINVGIAPFMTVTSRDGNIAYVSNWGGRFPSPGEPYATTGDEQKHPDHVLIDSRGVAADGTLSRIDVRRGAVTGTISVGLHPSSLWWDEPRQRLYVTNSNSDSISVVNTATQRVVQTFALRPFGSNIFGIAPNGIAGNFANNQLYVACGGINAVMVLRLSDGRFQGLIPTDWYPVQVALASDGHTLATNSYMGIGDGAYVFPGMVQQIMEQTHFYATRLKGGRWIGDTRGTVNIASVPQGAALGQATAQAMAATRMSAAHGSDTLVKNDPKWPPIDHIVYIIKENQTYDEFFGSLGKGNGDPKLNFYDETVIANHRALARDFVLLDNLYASGGSSGDGHQWVTQADETDYAYWPGYDGRSYPFDGSDPLAPANSGFIWTNAAAHGKSVAIFGEYAGTDKTDDENTSSENRKRLLAQWKAGSTFADTFHTVAPLPSVNRFLVRDYPGYGGGAPDVVRARIFLHHLKDWQQNGTMPNLSIVQLPSDHTGGTTPGYSTPEAATADNDYALGQIVEGVSHSRFWPHTAIFVVEDDAQGAVDHVDGHRIVALAISPYIRRHAIDSTFYSQVSIVKTIEEMLGLSMMTIYDRIANDMHNSFQMRPNLAPYTAIRPNQDLFAINPAAASLRGQARLDAIASSKMDWSEPDQAPAAQLTAILWREVKRQ